MECVVLFLIISYRLSGSGVVVAVGAVAVVVAATVGLLRGLGLRLELLLEAAVFF